MKRQKLASSSKLPDQAAMYLALGDANRYFVPFLCGGDAGLPGATFGAMSSTLYEELGGEPVLRQSSTACATTR